MAKKRNLSPVRILLDPKRYILVSAIGIGVALYMVLTQVDFTVLAQTALTSKVLICLLAALLCVFIRITAYMWRLKILTDDRLTWKQVVQVVFMWEFTSAITPSAVGGAPVAIYYMTKEGLSAGKSTSTVMLTALLDEVFFIVMLPFCYLFMQGDLFPSDMNSLGLGSGVKYLFFVSYFLIVVYALIISYGVLINPGNLKKFLLKIFQLKWLKRWHSGVEEVGNDIVIASKEIKGKGASFWLKALLATFSSWSARFILVNFIILSIVSVSDHFLVYARQLVLLYGEF